MLTAHAHGVDFRVNALVQSRLRRRDVVFVLDVGGFRNNLRITELQRAVGSDAVAVDAVLDRRDAASQRTLAVLERGTRGDVLRYRKVSTERTVTHVGLEFAAVVELVGFVAFARHVNPEVGAGRKFLIHGRTVGDRLSEHRIRTAGHSLDAGGREGAEAAGRRNRYVNRVAVDGAFEERIVGNNRSSVIGYFSSQGNGTYISIGDADVAAGGQPQGAVNGGRRTYTGLINHQ